KFPDGLLGDRPRRLDVTSGLDLGNTAEIPGVILLPCGFNHHAVQDRLSISGKTPPASRKKAGGPKTQVQTPRRFINASRFSTGLDLGRPRSSRAPLLTRISSSTGPGWPDNSASAVLTSSGADTERTCA